MKHLITFLSIALLALPVIAKRGQETEMFVLQGRTLELDIFAGTDRPASYCQILIYQDNELYVAFRSETGGDYEFYLPLGFDYEVVFGGAEYVNKKIVVITKGVKPGKAQYEVLLDVGVFRSVEQFTFDTLKEPVTRFGFDSEYKQFVPDLTYAEARAKELEKTLKKVRKSASARS